MEPTGGRRATDNISDAVRLAIEEAVADTRHTLRDEITVFAAKLEVFRLQSTQEHTEVKGHVVELIADMAEVKALVPRVVTLEQNDAVLAALATNRKWLIGAVTAIIGTVIAAAAFIVGALPH